MPNQNPNQNQSQSDLPKSTSRKGKKTLFIGLGVALVVAVAGFAIAINQGWLFKGNLMINTNIKDLISADRCLIQANCLYVYLGNQDPNPDGSVANPFRTITDAVKAINNNAQNGTSYSVIRVAGSAKPYANEAWPIMLDGPAVTAIQGGYSSDFSSRDLTANQTFISAGPAVNMFNLNHSNVEISGFTFGQVSAGGFYAINVINGGAPKISSNIFMNNDGAAIYVNAPGPQDAVKVTQNIFHDNNLAAGSVIESFGNLTLDRNFFYSNTGDSVVKMNGGAATNNIFAANTADTQAAGRNAIADLSAASFTYNTFQGNRVNAAVDHAVIVFTGPDNTVANNLISDTIGVNGGAAAVAFTGGGNADKSVVQFNATDLNDPLWKDPQFAQKIKALNNFQCDPGFPKSNSVSDPNSYKLSGTGSAGCIDRASTTMVVPPRDYFNAVRSQDGNGDGVAEPDPGAFEADTLTASAPPQLATCSGITLVPTMITAPGDTNYTVNVTFDDGKSYQTTLVWAPSNTNGKFDNPTTIDFSNNPQTNVFHATNADTGFTVKVDSVKGANNSNVCQNGVTVTSKASLPLQTASCSGITVTPQILNASGDTNLSAVVTYDDGKNYATEGTWSATNGTLDLSVDGQTTSAAAFKNVFHPNPGVQSTGVTFKVSNIQGANNSKVCQDGVTVTYKAQQPPQAASCSGITVTPQILNASGDTNLSAVVTYDDGKSYYTEGTWSVTNGTLDVMVDGQTTSAAAFKNVFHPAAGAQSASVTFKVSNTQGANNSKVCQTGFTVNMPVVNTPPGNTCGGFTDVAPSDTELCSLASEMRQAGLFTGTTFRAKDAVARYEVALMIVRALRLPAKDCTSADVTDKLKKFSDLDLKAPYIPELCLANGINVITGYKVVPPVMYPANQVNYREIFKMIYNGYVVLGRGASPRTYTQVAELLGFGVNEYNSWYGYPLQFLVNQGLYTLNQLKEIPLGAAMTRLQVARVMHLVLHKGQLTF